METLFIGKNPVFLPVTESTNSYAIELLKNVNPPEGTIVYTDHQTEGKGQRGAAWRSDPASNLVVSVILKPTFLTPAKQHYLYQIAALACYDTIAQLLDKGQYDIKIKWPNDILVNKYKVAGVLIENNFINEQIVWSVAGVGINVNQEDFKGLPHASSLKLLGGDTLDVRDVLLKFCYWFEKNYLALMSGKFSSITQRYLDSFFAINSIVGFEKNGQVSRMMVAGISNKGLLLLLDDNGHTHEADVKEVKWLL